VAAFLLREAVTAALVVEENRARNEADGGGGESAVRDRHRRLVEQLQGELMSVPGV
jgi:hypothetical protein